MNVEELNDKINTILTKEDFNLRKSKKFNYYLVSGNLIKTFSSGENNDPYEMDFDDVFKIAWETYETLNSLYHKIKSNSTLSNYFVNSMKETLRNDRLILGESDDEADSPKYYDTTSLSFYFLLKNGFIDEALDQIESSQKDTEKKNIKYLFLDVISFVYHEPKIFSRNSLDVLDKLFYFYAEEETRDNFHYIFTQIKYADIKEQLIGINQEIAYDRDEIIEKIKSFNFPDDLEKLLNDVEEAKKLTEIEAVNSGMINGLRQFFNDLIIHIAKKISTTNNEEIPHEKNRTKIGDARVYIKEKLDLGDKEDNFLDAYIEILHKQGGHKMGTKRKYLDLTENIGIEIAYFLLSELEKITTK